MEEASIVALATPPGSGAIGILRISGPQSLAILQKHCQPLGSSPLNFSSQPRRALLCDFIEEGKERQIIDRGLALYYPSPHSYTGEESAELFLHGNPLLLRKMIAAILQGGLARIARPGEFTQRAYLNGKLDLTQAEAVKQIIHSKSEWELKAAQRNLGGELRSLSAKLRSELLGLKAELEAGIDFEIREEEEDRKGLRLKNMKANVRSLQNRIESLLHRSKESERLRSTFQIAILGRPNAGKSSLFNHILGWDRSIVSPQSGTTRDYVSEEIQLEGLGVRLVDTAGLGKPQDKIEEEGIHRTQKICKQSQLLLHVIDSSASLDTTAETLEIQGIANIPKLEILNKCDLRQAKRREKKDPPSIHISCHTGEGLKKLRETICSSLLGKTDLQSAILLEERQIHHLHRAHRSLEKLHELIQRQTPPDEIIAIEIDQTMNEIGAITRPLDNEEVLGRIFSMFCIGK